MRHICYFIVSMDQGAGWCLSESSAWDHTRLHQDVSQDEFSSWRLMMGEIQSHSDYWTHSFPWGCCMVEGSRSLLAVCWRLPSGPRSCPKFPAIGTLLLICFFKTNNWLSFWSAKTESYIMLCSYGSDIPPLLLYSVVRRGTPQSHPHSRGGNCTIVCLIVAHLKVFCHTHLSTLPITLPLASSVSTENSFTSWISIQSTCVENSLFWSNLSRMYHFSHPIWVRACKMEEWSFLFPSARPRPFLPIPAAKLPVLPRLTVSSYTFLF